jgi:transposase
MEDLSVQEMAKRFGKSVMEAGLGELISQIKYKSTWYGKTFHQVSRWFASSKICNTCGQKNTGLTLGDREWACPSCGQIHDRDLNAANNILDRGLIDLYNFTSDELADYRRRGVVHGQVIYSPVGGFINETSSSDSDFIGVTASA